jgi:predicted amidohydrolase
MFSIKFIGEDLNFPPTARAFADERFQILKLLKAWTMSRDAHKCLLSKRSIHLFLLMV